MLKKKIKELVEKDQLENKFEVIHDSSALQIVGGDCGVLQNCGEYTGSNCPSLANCQTYKEMN